MSTTEQKDVGPGAVALMMGVSIGIPVGIVGGLFVGETGWGLILGPFIGLVIGAGLAMMGRGSEATA